MWEGAGKVGLGESIMWGAGEEAARIAQVKLFGSLVFPPLYYSLLPWRKTIYIHLSLYTCWVKSSSFLSVIFPLYCFRREDSEGQHLDSMGKSVQRSAPVAGGSRWTKTAERPTDRPDTVSVSLGLLARLPFSETSGFKGIIHFTV